jgi:hypothetical protein
VPFQPLLPGSPAIDAGSNARAQDPNGDGNTADAIATDVRGAARVFEGAGNGSVVVDIGAHEYDGDLGVGTPGVGHLTAEPLPLLQGTPLTLTASDAVSGSAAVPVVAVDFYRETNGVLGLQTGPGGDLLVGADASPAGGWSVQVSTGDIPYGFHTYYAVATDVQGHASPGGLLAAAAQHRVLIPLVVSTTADESDGNYAPGDLSLREAIQLAAAQAGPDQITFDPALSGSITLDPSLGPLTLPGDVTVTGPGAARLAVRAAGSGAMASRVFLVSGANNAISGLTITGGSNAAHPEQTQNGGGIYSIGGLTLTGCVISANTGANGAGIFNSSNGTLKLVDCTLAGNAATGSGGGVGPSGLSFDSSPTTSYAATRL